MASEVNPRAVGFENTASNSSLEKNESSPQRGSLTRRIKAAVSQFVPRLSRTSSGLKQHRYSARDQILIKNKNLRAIYLLSEPGESVWVEVFAESKLFHCFPVYYDGSYIEDTNHRKGPVFKKLTKAQFLKKERFNELVKEKLLGYAIRGDKISVIACHENKVKFFKKLGEVMFIRESKELASIRSRLHERRFIAISKRDYKEAFGSQYIPGLR